MLRLLQQEFENIPLIYAVYNHDEMEDKLSILIDNADKDDNAQRYLMLIAYYFYTNMISPDAAVMMSHYLSLKIQNNKNKVITKGVIEEIVKTALVGLLNAKLS